MTAEKGRRPRLPIDDRDSVDRRVFAEILNRTGKAPGVGTRLGAFMYLAEPWLTTSRVATLVGIDEAQMYQLMLREEPIPQEAQDTINGLYTIGALAWQECADIEDFDARVRAVRAKLAKPTFRLALEPEDPSSPGRSIIQAIKDGDLERVLSMADIQLGDPRND